MDALVAARTKLCSKATRLCNDLRSYRDGDAKLLDQDQLALKIHNVEKLRKELEGVQIQLDKFEQLDDSTHMQTMEDELFLASRVLSRLEKADETRPSRELRQRMWI